MLEAPPIQSQEIAPQPQLTGRGSGLEALLQTCAFAPVNTNGFIRVAGDDRVRWLNGMMTNSVQALTPGQGCYNFFLSAQGRIQGDATAWMLEDHLLLEVEHERIPALMTLLDHFIIMDDVELTDLGAAESLLVVGPTAPQVLASLGLTAAADAPGITHSTFREAPVDLVHAYSPLVPRFELWSKPETIAHLTEALRAVADEASPEDFEHLRLLEGTPLYGTDIRDRELPQETAQTRALHFSKGCYLGQEIVERIRSRGNVHRTFSGFTFTGSMPVPGTPLFAADAPEKSIGEVTSAAEVNLPSGPVVLGLGYIRREVIERGAALTYAGGTAAPASLPFRIHASQD